MKTQWFMETPEILLISRLIAEKRVFTYMCRTRLPRLSRPMWLKNPILSPESPTRNGQLLPSANLNILANFCLKKLSLHVTSPALTRIGIYRYLAHPFKERTCSQETAHLWAFFSFNMHSSGIFTYIHLGQSESTRRRRTSHQQPSQECPPHQQQHQRSTQ